jgi:3-isopropylmalate dehydrogenase
MERTYHIAWLPGDGIGRVVSHEALRVLRAAADAQGFALTVDEHLIGGAALDATGVPLPETTESACLAADAVLLGAVGGPTWDDVASDLRPERGLLALRKALGTFANLRPVRVPETLADGSSLRREVVAGTDLLIVRELTGGIYFGTPRGHEADHAHNTMRYTDAEIARIARVAFRWAERRSGRVTSVDKANVLEVSQRWRAIVSGVQQTDFPKLHLDHLYVDNAAMQLVRDPTQFDVIVTGNLFGDILSDLAAALPGSLGILPSASLGGRVGLFEPVHGSAPDLAGRGVANPIGAILSGAMLLDELGEARAAAAIRDGVDATLAAGARTVDLCSPDETPLSTTDMGARIAEATTDALSVTV